MAYKVYSDSYLKTMTKDYIIRQLRCAENNMIVALSRLDNQYENIKDWQPVEHSGWVTEMKFARNSGLAYYTHICNRCRFLYSGISEYGGLYMYCPQCGAKMDMNIEKEAVEL